MGAGSCGFRNAVASRFFDQVYAIDATSELLYRLVALTCSESYHSFPTDSCAICTCPNCGKGTSSAERAIVGAFSVGLVGIRPANGFGTDCVRKLGFCRACASCAADSTFRLRAPPDWLSPVLMLYDRLPTYDASTATFHGSWCWMPNEYWYTCGIFRSGLAKMTLLPS